MPLGTELSVKTRIETAVASGFSLWKRYGGVGPWLRDFATKREVFLSVFVGVFPDLVRLATGETYITHYFSIT